MRYMRACIGGIVTGIAVLPFCNVVSACEISTNWSFFLFFGPASATTLLHHVSRGMPTLLVLALTIMMLYGSYATILCASRRARMKVGVWLLAGVVAAHYVGAVVAIAKLEPNTRGVVASLRESPYTSVAIVLAFVVLNTFALFYGWPRAPSPKPPTKNHLS